MSCSEGSIEPRIVETGSGFRQRSRSRFFQEFELNAGKRGESWPEKASRTATAAAADQPGFTPTAIPKPTRLAAKKVN